jgi:hypothetical protein
VSDPFQIAIIASVIGVGGVILGVALASIINAFGRKRQERREKRNVRRVLRWENDYNRRNLEDFWRKITLEPPLQGLPEEIAFDRRQRLAREYLQPWGHAMWQSEAPRLSTVLNPQEFADSYELHARLDRFAARRADIQEILFDTQLGASADSEFRNRQMQSYTRALVEQAQLEATQQALRNFNERTMQMWNECEQIYTSFHGRGNLIAEDAGRVGITSLIRDWFGRMPKPKVSWEKQSEAHAG